MKLVASALLAYCALTGCTDEQNVGDHANPDARAIFQPARWAIALGSIGGDEAIGVTIDPAGDVIAGGDFSDTVDFGHETFTAPPDGAGWLSKRAGSDGSEIWTVAMGTDGAAAVTVSDVVAAADGSLIVAGTYNGHLVLDQSVVEGPPVGENVWDCFLAKYDGSGHAVWARGLGSNSNATEGSLAVGADGRVAMLGSYQGTVVFPNGTFTATYVETGGPMDEQDVFAAVFDADGTLAWGTSTVSATGAGPTSIALTAEDDVVLTGGMTLPTTFGTTTLQPRAYWSSYAARFTLAGNLLWARELGDANTLRRPGPIALGTNGELLFTSTNEPTLVGSDGVATNGVPGIDSLDANGHPVWFTQAVGGSAFTGVATVLSNGNVVTGGDMNGFPVDFGVGQGSGSDMLTGSTYLAAHDGSGDTLDAIAYGNTDGGTHAFKLASGASGSFALAGYFQGAIDFGTGPLRYAGMGDAMIVMLDTQP